MKTVNETPLWARTMYMYSQTYLLCQIYLNKWQKIKMNSQWVVNFALNVCLHAQVIPGLVSPNIFFYFLKSMIEWVLVEVFHLQQKCCFPVYVSCSGYLNVFLNFCFFLILLQIDMKSETTMKSHYYF
jgi:hypothetical protein